MKFLVIVLTVLMVGCASTPALKGAETAASAEMKVSYTCENGSTISTLQVEDSSVIKLVITDEVLKFVNQSISLKIAESASGTRYVNELNPASTYEWQTKKTYGVLTVTTPTRTYTLSCEAK